MLYQRWQRGNPTGGPGLAYGVRPVGTTKVEIISPEAGLSGIMLNPRERLTMTLTFTASTSPTSLTGALHVAQHRGSATGPDVGGVLYQLKISQ